jgi:methenyltetrahydromethanopterin cyclohydrolase
MQPSINENALAIFRDILDQKEELGCTVIEQENGTTIIDAGIKSTGSIEAGRLIGELCMGGLGAIRLSNMHIEDMTLPSVIVGTDSPAIATLGSQHSGWTITVADYSAFCSGPARALVFAENEIYSQMDYKDTSKSGVLLLETSELPTEAVTDYIAEKCDISSSDLYCVAAPTASKAGSVQISARILEVGFFRLQRLGLAPFKIRRGHAVAPIAPVAGDDHKAMGISNDCILYGGSVYLIIRSAEGDDIAALVEKTPFSTTSYSGTPFYDLFKTADFDFCKVSMDVFCPAEVTINDIETGEYHKAGELNPDILRASLNTE